MTPPDIIMKTVQSLRMGDAIGSPSRIIAVVLAPPELVHGRHVKVRLARFPGGEPVRTPSGGEEPIFETRTYLNPGAMVATRVGTFDFDGLDVPDAVAA